jgi:hypothetical protein
LTDAIAATDREKELCAKPWLSLTESWELAKLRGYPSTEESFNKNFDAQNLGSKYGIAKLSDKQKIQKLDKNGVERTYNVRVYKNVKTLTP